MSKRVQYPNGSIGFASDEVAAILSKRKGHKILDDEVPEPKKPAKADADDKSEGKK